MEIDGLDLNIFFRYLKGVSSKKACTTYPQQGLKKHLIIKHTNISAEIYMNIHSKWDKDWNSLTSVQLRQFQHEIRKTWFSELFLILKMQTRNNESTLINKELLYSAGNSARCYVAAWMGGEFVKNGHVYIRLSPFTAHLKLLL